MGDTTAIMLGSYANMSFLDFFWDKGRPSIFFAVELGAILRLILAFLFRKEKGGHPQGDPDPGHGLRAHHSPVRHGGAADSGLLPAGKAGDHQRPHLLRPCWSSASFTAPSRKKEPESHRGAYPPLIFGNHRTADGPVRSSAAWKNMGVIDAAAGPAGQGRREQRSLYLHGHHLASVLISAFIDNIPYVATMLPVVQGLSLKLGIDPTPLYFGLLSKGNSGRQRLYWGLPPTSPASVSCGKRATRYINSRLLQNRYSLHPGGYYPGPHLHLADLRHLTPADRIIRSAGIVIQKIRRHSKRHYPRPMPRRSGCRPRSGSSRRRRGSGTDPPFPRPSGPDPEATTVQPTGDAPSG